MENNNICRPCLWPWLNLLTYYSARTSLWHWKSKLIENNRLPCLCLLWQRFSKQLWIAENVCTGPERLSLQYVEYTYLIACLGCLSSILQAFCYLRYITTEWGCLPLPVIMRNQQTASPFWDYSASEWFAPSSRLEHLHVVSWFDCNAANLFEATGKLIGIGKLVIGLMLISSMAILHEVLNTIPGPQCNFNTCRLSYCFNIWLTRVLTPSGINTNNGK